MIPRGSPVTIWCQGTPGAEEYRLEKEGSRAPWKIQKPWEPGDKAKFSITYMTDGDVGRYRCHYHSPTNLSEPSGILDLVVTGERTLRGPTFPPQGVSLSQPSPGGHEGGVSPI